MEAILFCGIQATGKSTFYIEHFFKSHVRISLYLFNTRRKESIFLETCLQTRQRLVVDNTDPTRKERQLYIEKAKLFKFSVIGYYFQSSLDEAIARNKKRTGKEIIPVAGIGGTYKRFQKPLYQEGFDKLYTVTIENDSFVVDAVAKEDKG